MRQARWTFAASMPWHPHTYATRQHCRELGIEAEFLWFAALIEESGHWRIWGRHRWRTLDLDDRFFWLHWNVIPVGERTIINSWWLSAKVESGQLSLELD